MFMALALLIAASARQVAADDKETWQQLIQQRQQVFAELQELDRAAATATGNRRNEIFTRTNELREQVRTKIDPALREISSRLHAKEPNHAGYAYFAMEGAYRKYDYRRAAEIGDRLIAANQINAAVLSMAADSHFALHRFSKAETYYGRLQQQGNLNFDGRANLAAAQKFDAYWKHEQQIRVNEAQTDPPLPRVLLTTDQGAIELELFENQAPRAVSHFVSQVEAGKYDGFEFLAAGNRSFVFAQSHLANQYFDTLIPEAKQKRPEKCECHAANARRHFRGSLSLKCYGAESFGAAFVISLRPLFGAEQKNGNLEVGPPVDLLEPGSQQTVCGRVIKGIETVTRLLEGGKILRARVIRKRDHPYPPVEPPVSKHAPTLAESGKFDQAIVQLQTKYKQTVAKLGQQSLAAFAVLNELALAYLSKGEYELARERFEEVYAGRQAKLGAQSAETAEAANNLAVALFREGKWATAQKHLQQALRVRQNVLGKKHPQTAQSLLNLIVFKRLNGQSAPIWKHYEETRDVLLDHLEDESRATSADLVEAWLDRIRPPILQDKQILVSSDTTDQLQGRRVPFSPQAGRILNRIGTAEKATYRYNYLSAAVANKARVYGEDHFQSAVALVNLCGETRFPITRPYMVAQRLDELRIARLQHALHILQATVGKDHPYATAAQHNLGIALLSDVNRREIGLQHLEDVHQIVRKNFGPTHPRTALALETLGLAAVLTGDYHAAVEQLHENYRIRVELHGKEHRLTAEALGAYGVACFLQGQFQTARKALMQAFEVRRKLDGYQSKGPLDAAPTEALIELGVVLRAQGDLDAACNFFTEALESLKQGLAAQDNFELQDIKQRVQQNLLLARLENGDEKLSQQELTTLTTTFQDALAHYRSRVRFAIDEEESSKASVADLHFVLLLSDLALLYTQQGKLPQAEPLYREAVAISLKNLELSAAVQSEQQQLAMSRNLWHRLDRYLSLATRHPQFVPPAYESVLAWKGLVFRRQHTVRTAAGQPELKAMLERLREVSAELAMLALSAGSREDNVFRISELSRQRQDLERQLMQATQTADDDRRQVSLQTIQSCLPDKAVLIDFIESNQTVPRTNDRVPHLLAFLVWPDRPTKLVNLGRLEVITAAINRWRKEIYTTSQEHAHELRRLVWEPLETHLGESRTVLISPVGPLGRLPFGALPGSKKDFLTEEVAIGVVPASQILPDLLRDRHREGRKPMLLLGGVNYERANAPQDEEPATQATGYRAARASDDAKFSPLPGTEAEISTIKQNYQRHFPDGELMILREARATETAFRREGSRHRYLHIATHGFFAASRYQSALARPIATRALLDDERGRPLSSFHPGLLSGIVLAGANNPELKSDDGILTAAEVSTLDLRKVELAVLSACETGLGPSAGGEGILGLQRAFQVSGARTTITSLWKVDDQATRILMERFYENLWNKQMGKLEALREAQLWMLKGQAVKAARQRGLKFLDEEIPPNEQGKLPPYYWAAFVLSGDWR